MNNEQYYIGANDEHGLNPPTAGKRTPVMPGLNRQIYENEVNRAAKNKFIEGALRNGFRVFDVKPELQDISVSARVARINRQNLTLLVTFGYNAFGAGNSFNSASGVTVYYSPRNVFAAKSRVLSEELYESLITGTAQTGRGVSEISDIGVLTNVNCPSSLIEAGFMTNLREAQLMLDPDFQTEIGEDGVEGVCNYLGVEYIPRELKYYRLIKKGDTGNFVMLLQFMLSNYGYETDTDGIFGNDTRNELIAFQSENGLVPDGIAGNETWRTLLLLPPRPTLRNGSRGVYVKYLQRMLESYLIPVGGVDGIFGAKTQSAVKEFQSLNGLVPDGIVGNMTWEKLTQSR